MKSTCSHAVRISRALDVDESCTCTASNAALFKPAVAGPSVAPSAGNAKPALAVDNDPSTGYVLATAGTSAYFTIDLGYTGAVDAVSIYHASATTLRVEVAVGNRLGAAGAADGSLNAVCTASNLVLASGVASVVPCVNGVGRYVTLRILNSPVTVGVCGCHINLHSIYIPSTFHTVVFSSGHHPRDGRLPRPGAGHAAVFQPSPLGHPVAVPGPPGPCPRPPPTAGAGSSPRALPKPVVVRQRVDAVCGTPAAAGGGRGGVERHRAGDGAAAGVGGAVERERHADGAHVFEQRRGQLGGGACASPPEAAANESPGMFT